MSHRHKVTSLSKLISYVLRYRPDEFGLVLDEEGFVPLKELQQAIAEEEGWSFVRSSHITEAAYTSDRELFEIADDRIRATHEHSRPVTIRYEQTSPPRILYCAVRRKAYPHILQRGLDPMGRNSIHLSVSEELALRIGRRRDPNPVVVEIQAQRAAENGVLFFQANPLLYLANHIPQSYITGPPLAKVLPEKKLPGKKRQEAGKQKYIEPQLPGSVLLNLRMEPLYKEEGEKNWKDHARRNRRKQRQL